MHILFLSAWCPLPADNGSKLRISSLLRELAGQHQVDLLAFAPEPTDIDALDRLQEICDAVELVPESPFAGRGLARVRGLLSTRPRSEVANYSPAMAAAVERQARFGYDLVIASQVHMAPYALLVPDTPRLLEEVDLGQLRDQYVGQRGPLRRLRYGLTWWKASRRLAAILQHFAAATVVADQEQALVQPLAPRHVVLEVIPNGVDVEACAGTFGSAETDTLVYAGALSYEANFDAVLYFARSILPLIRLERPGVRLRVTGRATPGQIAALPSAEGIEFTGYLDDVRPTIARSWAEVVPLRKGGGTRLKVLEALALGTPVVSTPKGVQGLEIEAGQHALVADSSAKFAAATVDLLGKPELRQRLAIAGCELVRERYDWRDIGRRFNDLVIQVVPQTGGTQSLISAIDPRVAQRTSEQRREEQASLCIIVVSWNTAQLLARCLESVYAHPPDCTFEVCVVDNASIDGSAQLVKDRFPKVRLIQNQENVGFARANNQAIRESSADFLLLLNSDTLVPGGALDTLLDCMKARPLAGACGPMLVSPNGSFQASYADFPTLSTQLIHQLGLGRWLLGRYYPSHGPAESQHSRVADWVGGASLLVRRHCLNMIGLLDESFFMYGEEMDWCYRMKATGWEVWYCHEARIVHLGGASSRLTPVSRHVQLQQAKVRFFRKHYGVISAQLLSMAIGITSLLKACACLLIVSVANRRSRPKMKTRLRSYLATARMFLSLTPA